MVTHTNVATPKMSKNRLVSDFCLSCKFDDIVLLIRVCQ